MFYILFVYNVTKRGSLGHEHSSAPSLFVYLSYLYRQCGVPHFIVIIRQYKNQLQEINTKRQF